MSNNSKMIVFASVMGAILATGILALNPSIIGNAQAQSYGYNDQYSYDGNYYKDDNRYGYDGNYYQDDNRNSYDNKHQKKSSHTDIQKIKCVNSNINVNGIDITQIPQDATALGATNEKADAANTQNGNGLVDRINFERNLVNVCVNVNDNEQIKFSGPGPEPSTLTIIKHVSCEDLTSSETDVSVQQRIDLCQALLALITADQYLIDVIGNNAMPSQFGGSEVGTVVKLGPGNYQVKELITASVVNEVALFKQQNPNIDVLISAPRLSGDCLVGSAGNGIIGPGESQTCNIENHFTIESVG